MDDSELHEARDFWNRVADDWRIQVGDDGDIPEDVSTWAHFTSAFIWFHRPLSAYWKAFRDAGFDVAFKLRKPHSTVGE